MSLPKTTTREKYCQFQVTLHPREQVAKNSSSAKGRKLRNFANCRDIAENNTSAIYLLRYACHVRLTVEDFMKSWCQRCKKIPSGSVGRHLQFCRQYSRKSLSMPVMKTLLREFIQNRIRRFPPTRPYR